MPQGYIYQRFVCISNSFLLFGSVYYWKKQLILVYNMQNLYIAITWDIILEDSIGLVIFETRKVKFYAKNRVFTT